MKERYRVWHFDPMKSTLYILDWSFGCGYSVERRFLCHLTCIHFSFETDDQHLELIGCPRSK